MLRCNITCLNGSGGPRYVSEYTSISSYLSGERYLEWVHDNGIRSDKAGDCSVCLVRFFFFATGRNQRTSLNVKGVAFLAFIFNEICVMNKNTRVMFFLFDFLIYGRITWRLLHLIAKCRHNQNINVWDTYICDICL